MLNLIFVFLVSQVWATSLQAAPDFQTIQSASIQVQPVLDKLPDNGRPGIVKILSHPPSGAPDRANKPECSAFGFEDLMLQIKAGRAGTGELQSRFTACEKHLTRFASSKLISELKLGAVTYKLNEHRNIREVELRLPGALTRRGLLGLKGGRKPLVIIQCGLFCDIYDLSAKILFMDIYDLMPFHVLMLGSLSHGDTVTQNQTLPIGGYTEGIQLMEVVHLVTDPREPISKLVDGVHIIGDSLGGHGALYAGLYGSSDPQHTLRSVTGLCPVVSYKASVENLMTGDTEAQAMGQRSWQVIHDALSEMKVPGTETLMAMGPDHLADLVQSVGILEYGRRSGWLPAPLQTYVIQTPDDFWNLGQFSKFASQLSVPTFVWASQDDNVVLTKTNAALLEPYSKIQTLISGTGRHCMETVYYGLDVASSIIRGHILAESGTFLSGRQEMRLALTKMPELYDDETYFSYEWRAHEKNMEMILKIWSPDTLVGSSRCGSWDPYFAFEGCFRQVSVTMAYSSFAGSDLFVPQTDAEEDSLTRWANGNLRVLSRAGANLHNTLSAPSVVQWYRYGAR